MVHLYKLKSDTLRIITSTIVLTIATLIILSLFATTVFEKVILGLSLLLLYTVCYVIMKLDCSMYNDQIEFRQFQAKCRRQRRKVNSHVIKSGDRQVKVVTTKR